MQTTVNKSARKERSRRGILIHACVLSRIHQSGRPSVVSVKETATDATSAVIIQSLMNKVERLQKTTTDLQQRLEASTRNTATKDELMLKSLQQLTTKLETLEETRAIVPAQTTTDVSTNQDSNAKDPNLCHYLERELGIACGNPRQSGSLFCTLHERGKRCRHRSRRGRPCGNITTSAHAAFCTQHTRPKVNTKKCRAITHGGRQCLDAPFAGGILCNNHLKAQNKAKK